MQAYYAGYLEGLISARLIESFRHNVDLGSQNNQSDKWCLVMSDFIEDNLDYMVENVLNPRNNTQYWNQVGLSLYQLAGIDDGIDSAHGRFKGISLAHFL